MQIICKNNIDRTENIIRQIGIPWCLEIFNSKIVERVNAAQYCLQVDKFNIKYKKLLYSMFKYISTF